MSFTLALVQMTVTGGRKQENLSRAGALIAEAAENGAFGVAVALGVLVGTGVSVAGTRFASVLVGGGVIEGNNVAVGET